MQIEKKKQQERERKQKQIIMEEKIQEWLNMKREMVKTIRDYETTVQLHVGCVFCLQNTLIISSKTRRSGICRRSRKKKRKNRNSCENRKRSSRSPNKNTKTGCRRRTKKRQKEKRKKR